MTDAPAPSARPTVRRMRGGRLAYFRAEATGDYWDRRWADEVEADLRSPTAGGELGRFERFFIPHLPKQGRILEAGCGTGMYVAALRARGYAAEGVDFAEATVATIRRARPELPVRAADVTALNEPDGAFAGYISIGVMEHREAGPGPFLREAHRVLEDDGVALISVPYMHPLRRLKARLGCWRGPAPDRPFYQYAFYQDDFAAELGAAGFRVEAAAAYDGFKGLKDELPGAERPLRWFRRMPLAHRRTRRMLEASRFGHMMMFVCRKAGASSVTKPGEGEGA